MDASALVYSFSHTAVKGTPSSRTESVDAQNGTGKPDKNARRAHIWEGEKGSHGEGSGSASSSHPLAPAPRPGPSARHSRAPGGLRLRSHGPPLSTPQSLRHAFAHTLAGPGEGETPSPWPIVVYTATVCGGPALLTRSIQGVSRSLTSLSLIPSYILPPLTIKDMYIIKKVCHNVTRKEQCRR